MYDLSYFRNNLDAIAARLATRGYQLDVVQFRDLDAAAALRSHRPSNWRRRPNAATPKTANCASKA